MKKLLFILLAVMVLSTNVFAQVDPEVAPDPDAEVTITLYDETAIPTLISEPMLTLYLGEGQTKPVTTDVENMPLVADGGPVLILESGVRNVYINEELISLDVPVQNIDGVTMLPLRLILEALGYSVTWNEESERIDIIKGAKFTSIKLGDNAYFFNKVAPFPLSMAPVALNNRTLVPVEFFYQVLGESITVDSKDIYFNNDMMAVHEGFVLDITYDETGTKTITIGHTMDTAYEMSTIIHTNQYFTIEQKSFEIGDYITVLSPPVMTMSLPAQTSGIVIY